MFPVGYWLWTDPGERERHGILRILLGPVRPAPRGGRPVQDAP
jgi:hypothetical protein